MVVGVWICRQLVMRSFVIYSQGFRGLCVDEEHWHKFGWGYWGDAVRVVRWREALGCQS